MFVAWVVIYKISSPGKYIVIMWCLYPFAEVFIVFLVTLHGRATKQEFFVATEFEAGPTSHRERKPTLDQRPV
jgi:hypothetical protein